MHSRKLWTSVGSKYRKRQLRSGSRCWALAPGPLYGGLANVERERHMRVGIQQPNGSVTKTMTGTLILQLVE